MASKSWRLVADIGGTNARFALQDGESGSLELIRRYSVAQHARFTDALRHFIDDVAEQGWQPLPDKVCLAVACPTAGETIQFTNSSWVIHRKEVSKILNVPTTEIINDFTAVGHAITDLDSSSWVQIGGSEAMKDSPIAILGPGTGLGVCSVVPVNGHFHIVEGEGGHADFAPIGRQEIAVLEILSRRFGRVSAERVLSGAGILNIYTSLAELSGKQPLHDSPAGVTDAALEGVETLAVNSLQMFCQVLGAFAGNLALTMGAKGGVYVAGGIAARFTEFLMKSDFRYRFESKGRFRGYLSDIPVRVVVNESQNLGLLGAAKKLNLLEL